jgi:hypothetical protein
VPDGLFEIAAHPGRHLDRAGMRTAQPLGSQLKLGEGIPGIDPERGDCHHSFQPELRRGRYPIRQCLKL